MRIIIIVFILAMAGCNKNNSSINDSDIIFEFSETSASGKGENSFATENEINSFATFGDCQIHRPFYCCAMNSLGYYRIIDKLEAKRQTILDCAIHKWQYSLK